MAGLNRTELARARGLIEYDGATIFSRNSGITVNFVSETKRVPSDNHGENHELETNRFVEVLLNPLGEVEDLAVLYPHLTKTYGASACGSTDKAAVVKLDTGEWYTLHNAIVYKQPDLNLGIGQDLFGQTVLRGLIKNQADPADDNAWYTEATAQTYPGDGEADLSLVKEGLFSAAWGADPWDEWWADNGFRVSFATELLPAGPDTLHSDYIMGNQTVTVTARPKGITAAQLMARINARFQGRGLGLDANPGATDLVISNDYLYFALYGADLANPSLIAKKTEDVLPELTWRNVRPLDSGAETAVAYVGAAAPA